MDFVPLGAKSILQGVDRCGDSAAAADELLATLGFLGSCAEQLRYIGLENIEISFAEGEKSCSFGGNFVCLENIGEEKPKMIEQN